MKFLSAVAFLGITSTFPESDEISLTALPNIAYKNMFYLVSPSKTHVFVCTTKEDKTAWVQKINEVIAELVSSNATLAGKILPYLVILIRIFHWATFNIIHNIFHLFAANECLDVYLLIEIAINIS